jgi:hypothetical protein
MSFFEQELIQGELQEMTKLYEEIRFMMSYPHEQSLESRKECLDKLERLVELQELLYFRAKYSDDSEAKDFAVMIKQSAILLGVPSYVDISEIFAHMRQDIERARNKLDKSA